MVFVGDKKVTTPIRDRAEGKFDTSDSRLLRDWVRQHRGTAAFWGGALLVVALLLAPLHVRTHPPADMADDGTPLFV